MILNRNQDFFIFDKPRVKRRCQYSHGDTRWIFGLDRITCWDRNDDCPHNNHQIERNNKEDYSCWSSDPHFITFKQIPETYWTNWMAIYRTSKQGNSTIRDFDVSATSSLVYDITSASGNQRWVEGPMKPFPRVTGSPRTKCQYISVPVCGEYQLKNWRVYSNENQWAHKFAR